MRSVTIKKVRSQSIPPTAAGVECDLSQEGMRSVPLEARLVVLLLSEALRLREVTRARQPRAHNTAGISLLLLQAPGVASHF